MQTFKGHTRSVRAVAFSQDGTLLASASTDGTVRLWNPRISQDVQTLKGATRSVNAMVFSQDGTLLASALEDGTVKLWNPHTLEEHTRSVRAMAFSQDGTLLASASSDGTVMLWNPHTGQEVQTHSFGDAALLTNRGIPSMDDGSFLRLNFESSAQ
jgi:WD40 repeat protein